MSHVDAWFYGLMSFAAVSCILLSIGSILTQRLRQPIERIRCIQWTMVALLATLMIRQASLLPDLGISLLPALDTQVMATDENSTLITTLSQVPPRLDTALPSADTTSASVTVSDETSSIALATPTDIQGMQIWQWVRASAVAIVLLVACWCAVHLLLGRLQLHRLLRHSVPVSDVLLEQWNDRHEAQRFGTRVLMSREVHVPITFGVWRPYIIVPERLHRLHQIQQLTYCLTHEWAHIRQRDIVTWWSLQLMQPFLWMQPAFWYLRRELRTCQDQLADRYAVRQHENPTDYAQFLVSLARRSTTPGGCLALTMADRRSSLYRRIELLLSDRFPVRQSVRRRVLVGLTCAMIITSVMLGAIHIERAAAQTGDESSASSQKQQEQPAENSSDRKDQGESLSFSGVVLDKISKEPIAGAKVVVRRMILRSDNRRILEESEHETDGDGRYEFVIPPEQVAESSLYIELDVEHEEHAPRKGFGYALSMIRKNLRLGEQPFFAEIEISPSEPIRGRVVDPNGNSLAGVALLGYSRSSAENFRDYGSFVRGKTDSEGKFKLNMVKGGPSLFWIVPEGYAPQQIVSSTKRGDWGDIKLEEGIALSGQILGATGEPVEGVWVNLVDEEAQREIQMPVASSMRRSALTDENGKFTMEPMKPGKYRLDVQGYPSEIRYNKRGRNPVPVDDVFVAQSVQLGPQDASRPIVVQAVPHIEVVGRYVDSKGEPCRGHEVMVWGNMNGQWYHTSIRPDGEGNIVGKLPHGLEKTRLNAITNEHGSLLIRLKKGGPLKGSRDLDLGTLEDDLRDFEIIRYKAPIVQIKPIDKDGNTVNECKVAGIYDEGSQELMHPVGGLPTNIFFEKQADGRHRTSQLLPDMKITFKVQAEGYQESTATVSLPEGEEREITVVMEQAKPAEGDSAANTSP